MPITGRTGLGSLKRHRIKPCCRNGLYPCCRSYSACSSSLCSCKRFNSCAGSSTHGCWLTRVSSESIPTDAWQLAIASVSLIRISPYGAVKVRYDGETKGGVETLEVAVNAENYKSILELFKEALIENAMGYDAKDDRLSGNPNQMSVPGLYSGNLPAYYFQSPRAWY